MPDLHPRILEECFSHLMPFGYFHFKRKAELERSHHIYSFITYLLLQYQMVEKDEYGDYDAGDQGNAPHLNKK